MKKILVLSILAVFAIGCGNAAEQSKAPQQSNNGDVAGQKKDESLTVSSHSQNPPAGNSDSYAPPGNVPPVRKDGAKSKWTQSGSPIDTTAFDAKIAAAEKNLKARANDDGVKKALSAAYLERAVALTDARQYASALGDYRRAMKYDQDNETAKKWIQEIINIYDSMNKSYPPEGEEPPALEFKQTA